MTRFPFLPFESRGSRIRCGLATASLLCPLILPLTAAGASLDNEGLRRLVERHLAALPPIVAEERRREILVGDVDPLLRPPACPDGFRVTFADRRPPAPGRTSVEIRCERPVWRIRLPVTLRVWAPVVVARDAVPPRTRLTAEHLRMENRELSALHHGYYLRMAGAIGGTTKYALRPGQVISPAAISPQQAVGRGEIVRLHNSGPGFRITAEARALEAGQIGDRIRVRNLRSGRIVEAIVTARGEVSVRRTRKAPISAKVFP